MKIKCQEHYDKVLEYAKSIGDTTFEKCIERLKQWEKNSNGRYEIELYWDFAPYSFGFAPDFVTFWRLKNIISDFQQHRIIKG
ncbi:DUF4120 family protein [Bacteroides acidifaciens]|uniref:DUF4120 family protein n=1 Tax=Bacteroides acidifaciens TaxID=85831 RepID=UPI002100E934|nr:DUF4120 family protein [Bacteroides acidifaciens]